MTRMWSIDPVLLCDQHLLGEHNELHQLVGYINSDRDWSAKLQAHAEAGEIDTTAIKSRHDSLASEMLNRGMNHQSPLRYDDELRLGQVDVEQSVLDLRERCAECRSRLATEAIAA